MKALDLFAGTGWGVACQRLGIEEYGVEIMPEAVATREINGMNTIFNDVWDGLEDANLVPDYDLLIASPPCQTFSVAGKGAGRKALDDVLSIAKAIGEAWNDGYTYSSKRLRAYAVAFGDDRTALVLTPLLYALRDRPAHIAFEQVPTVLPVWEACAEVLRDAGYSVVTGLLQAEQYGVPQTRKRAFLVARNDGVEAKMPTPTHSRYYPREPQRLDPGVQPWVSMADALGWEEGFGEAHRHRGAGMLERHGQRHGRPTDEPSPTITGNASGTTPGGFAVNPWADVARPAPTVTGGGVCNRWSRTVRTRRPESHR